MANVTNGNASINVVSRDNRNGMNLINNIDQSTRDSNATDLIPQSVNLWCCKSDSSIR